ncbi:RHS repeat-associated core domain-containing protein [Arthrobacter halodurans]
MTSHVRSGTTYPYTYAGPSNTERLSVGGTTFVDGLLGITRQSTGGAVTSFVREPDGTLVSMSNGSGTYYYTADALGSTIALTDASQGIAAAYTYDAWGRTTPSGPQSNNNRFQYIGQHKDLTTGLYKFGARYYDAVTGRFTQPDPSGQEANTYAYAECNPINLKDPSGLAPSTCQVSGATTAGLTAATGALAVWSVVATGTIVGAPAGVVLTAATAAAGAGAALSGIFTFLSCT